MLFEILDGFYTLPMPAKMPTAPRDRPWLEAHQDSPIPCRKSHIATRPFLGNGNRLQCGQIDQCELTSLCFVSKLPGFGAACVRNEEDS